MSSTNKTTNYNLSQFVGTDVPSYLGDYNGDMSKIDKAIGDVANSQGSVEQSVVGLTAEVQGLSTQVDGMATSVQQVQTTVAQIDTAYKQADTALSQRITTNANNIQTNTTAIDSINTAIGTEDISEIGDGTIKGAISNLNDSVLSMNLLWTNDNPTSEFTPKTISLNINPYKWLIVYCKISLTTNSRLAFLVRNGVENYLSCSISSSGNTEALQRNIKITDTSVEFTNGLDNGSINNNIILPLEIYAIK